MADTVEAVGQGVEQEPADELVRRQRVIEGAALLWR